MAGIKNRPHGRFFYFFLSSEKYLAKSDNVIFNEFNTLATVHIDGQRSLPDGNIRLLLLNVVESNPLSFARPDTLILFANANLSNARHVCEFVIIMPSYILLNRNYILIIVDFILKINLFFITKNEEHYWLQTTIYGGSDLDSFIPAAPQSIQLNLRFCECAESIGTDLPAIAGTLDAYF